MTLTETLNGATGVKRYYADGKRISKSKYDEYGNAWGMIRDSFTSSTYRNRKGELIRRHAQCVRPDYRRH